MEQIPFFPKLIIYGQVISGIFFFIESFSSKQRKAMVDSLGEGAAKKVHLLLRYGGPVLILIGGIQYLIKDL